MRLNRVSIFSNIPFLSKPSVISSYVRRVKWDVNNCTFCTYYGHLVYPLIGSVTSLCPLVSICRIFGWLVCWFGRNVGQSVRRDGKLYSQAPIGALVFKCLYVYTLRTSFGQLIVRHSWNIVFWPYLEIFLFCSFYFKNKNIFFCKACIFSHICIITLVGFSFQILAESEQDF